jgi:hypothetical protein
MAANALEPIESFAAFFVAVDFPLPAQAMG